jgi:Septum formation
MGKRGIPGLVLAVAVVAMLAAGCSKAQRDAEGKVQSAGRLSIFQLAVGDCFNDPKDVSRRIVAVSDIDAVPCGEAHDKEVFAVLAHPAAPGSAFPGDDQILQFAESHCLEQFQAYVGRAYGDSGFEIAVVRPVEESWTRKDDRQVACVLYSSAKRLTGSQKGSGA